MTGGRRSAIVTGGTSGIGREVALALSRRGWRVLVTGRDAARSSAIVAECGGGCTTATVDLSDMAAVRAFGSARRDLGEPLDLLVCNAGVMAPPTRLSGEDGHELQLTVNHLAHYVLVARLSPVMKEAEAPRVVWVTSVRHHAAPTGGEDAWDPVAYDGRESYATSKAWNLALALWLDNRWKTDPAAPRSVAAHPGWSRTGLQATGPLMGAGSAGGRRQAWLTARLGQSAARGAIPVLAAALDPLGDGPTHLGPSGPMELWGRRAAKARISAMAADEGFQGWVASKSAELTRTALPT